MSTVDELLEPSNEDYDFDYYSPGPQTLDSVLEVSRDECSALFRFLQQTKEGEDFLQAHYDKLQEYKSSKHGRKAKQKSNKVLKLTDARKYEQWEGLKFEFFFYYIQNLPSARIEAAMKDAYPECSDYRSRTMDTRLENWGFTLCPRFRRAFIQDLRGRVAWEQPANGFFDDEIFGPSSPLPHIGQTMPYEGISSLPVAAPVTQISGTVASGSHLSDVYQDPQPDNIDFIFGGDLNKIPPLDSLPNLGNLFRPWNFWDPVLHRIMYPPDDPAGTIVDSMIDQMRGAPGGSSRDGPDVTPDIDSGYHSMEVCDPASSENMPRADQVQNNANIPFYPESQIPHPPSSRIIATTSLVQYSPSGIENRQSYPSIFHRVPCGKNHLDIVLGFRHVCSCGVMKVHAFCLEMGNFEDEKVLEFLSSINNMTECDGAGNTVLHYAAAAGRRAIIEHILQSDVDIQLHNSFGQNFLHVLDGTCFGGELIEFLSLFRNRGLLDQRDHSGRTILHGLLQHPIERAVCEQLVDFYGPEGSYQFALRDNQGRNAAEYLRARFPNSFHNHANYVQTILLFETFAETFVIKPTSSGQIHPQTVSGDRCEIPKVLNTKPSLISLSIACENNLLLS